MASADQPIVERAVLEAEVDRLVAAVAGAGGTLRVLGSIAVSRHCHEASQLIPAFSRTYADIDFAAYRHDAKLVADTLAGLGYAEDREIAMTSEGKRGLYDSPASRIHLDVFFERLEFCHIIPLAGRLEVDSPTLPVAELLLSKLQIVKINEKDVVDTILLLLDHALGSSDADAINTDVVARLCAADWGLWRTITANLDKVLALSATFPQLSGGQRQRVAEQAAGLRARIDSEPKPFSWRTRARVGDRVKWWTDVDEVR